MEDRVRLHWFVGLRNSARKEEKFTVKQKLNKVKLNFYIDQCKPSNTPANLNPNTQTAQKVEEVGQKT